MEQTKYTAFYAEGERLKAETVFLPCPFCGEQPTVEFLVSCCGCQYPILFAQIGCCFIQIRHDYNLKDQIKKENRPTKENYKLIARNLFLYSRLGWNTRFMNQKLE